MTGRSRILAPALCVAALFGCSKSESGGTSLSTAAASTSNPTSVASSAAPTTAPLGAAAPVEVPDPIIVMRTTLGDVLVKLYQKQAPRTVANFLSYARTGHYDGTIFHQVDPGYVALAGGFDDKLAARPVRYPIPNEAANGLKNVRGTLAMARDPADPNSATASFFINLADNPKLDHRGDSPEQFGYCVFGQIVGGLEIVEKLSQLKTASVKGFNQLPVETVKINTLMWLR